MPQGKGKKKGDQSPAANKLRSAVAAQRGAREMLKDAGGISGVANSKLKREVAKADKAAFDAATEYRNSRRRAR